MATCVKKTKYLITAYINDLYNYQKRIPTDIINLAISYVDNYFENYGEYTWKITDYKLIKSMCNAKIGDTFDSPVFQMAKLKWIIQIVPKMDDKPQNKDRLQVYLRLLSWHHRWQKIVFCRSIEYLEELYSDRFISTKTKGERCQLLSWNNLSKNLQNQKSITIKVSADILNIITAKSIDFQFTPNPEYDEPFKGVKEFIYKINEAKLNKMLATSKHRIVSEIFDGILNIRLFATGRGNVLCGVQLCKWPPYTEQMIVHFEINCLELKDIGTQWMTRCVTLEKQTACMVWNWFNLSRLTDFTSLTINVVAKLSIVRNHDVVNEEVYDMMGISNSLIWQ